MIRPPDALHVEEKGGAETWAAEVRVIQQDPTRVADASRVFRRLAGYGPDLGEGTGEVP